MIYLDNAATTWPKPPVVRQAIAESLIKYGANPGRGGHQMAMETAGQIYACRETAAAFFGLENPANVIFTANCTMALNMVIKGLLANGGHAVVSDMEHNAVIRPLEALADRGVSYTEATVCEGNVRKTVENFRKAIRPNTRLILCTHSSNVFGNVLPIRELGALAHRYDIPFAVDGAQSGGHLPIHIQRDHIDFLCLPGHKGLYGPMGTGLLLCQKEWPLKTLLEGGTGNQSLSKTQPEDMPERLESGTVNVSGICGLHAGIRWVAQQSVAAVEAHETALLNRFYGLVANTSGVRLYTPFPRKGESSSLLSFNLEGKTAEETAFLLAREGVAVRGGLHCAPAAHLHKGTLPHGTVRMSLSAFNTRQEVEQLHKILVKILRKP